MKFIKISSKGTRIDSLNVLKKNITNNDEAKEILGKLIKIDPNQRHLVQLAKFFIENNDLEIIAKTYRRYENIKQRIDKDITHFKTFEQFQKTVENTRSNQNLKKAIDLDETEFKEHTNKILELFKEDAESVELTANYYLQYMTIENPEKQFNEFNTLQELATFITENIQANAGEIDESEFENLGNQEVEVYYAKNKEESKKLSQGYGFCVGWETNNQFWNYRLGRGERCFYFVRFKNRKPEENNYIVIQPRNDGRYQWTNTANNNGEPIITEQQLKELFPELERFNFKETFKYIPLTEQEKKYARKVSLQQFQDFNYDERIDYIEFGHELTEHQFFLLTEDLSNNKELIRGYINRLDTLLPIRFFDEIKDDKSLVSSYINRILYVLEKDPFNYEYVPDELKTDPRMFDITLYVLEKDPFNYEYVPDELKTDPKYAEKIKEARIKGFINVLKKYTSEYQYVPDELKTDPRMFDITLYVLEKDPYRYKDIHDELKTDPKYAERLKEARIKGFFNKLEINPLYYEYVPYELKTDPKYAERLKEARIKGFINVLEEEPWEYKDVPDELKTDPRMFDITLYVLEKDPYRYKDIHDELKNDPKYSEKIKEAAIKGFIKELKFNPKQYYNVPDELKTDPRMFVGNQSETNITLYVLKKYPGFYYIVPDELKTDPRMFDITLYVLEKYTNYYKYVPDSVKALIEQRKNNEETEGNEEEVTAKNWYKTYKIAKRNRK